MRYYHQDHLGSSACVIDADGKCKEAAEEMAKTKDPTQAVKDRFKDRADRFKEDCPSVSVGAMTTTTSGGASAAGATK